MQKKSNTASRAISVKAVNTLQYRNIYYIVQCTPYTGVDEKFIKFMHLIFASLVTFIYNKKIYKYTLRGQMEQSRGRREH